MKQRFILTIGILLSGCSFSWAQKFTVENAEGVKIKYEVTSTSEKTVQVTGGGRSDELIIPATVEYNGTTYKVTEIKDKAYKSRVGGKMYRIVLPEGLIGIGYGAFHGALKKNTGSVYIPSSVSFIGEDAFLYEDGWGPNVGNYKLENLPSYITSSNCNNIGIDGKCVALYYSKKPNRQQTVEYAQSSAIPSDNNIQVATTPVPKQKVSDVDINLPSSPANNENTFAVIIANENYQDEEKVEYAMNDGEMFKVYCHKVLGIPEDNIHFRKDATLNNIKSELSWLEKVASTYKGKARFIVYYVGHGIPDEKSGVSYLLPSDGQGEMIETGYSMQELYKQLGVMPSAGVTVFMDACFSGSKRGEGMLVSARGVAIKAKTESPRGKMVVFSAAQGDETAYPYKEKEHGLFTYYLLKKLKDTGGNVTFGDLGNYIEEQVARKSIVINGKSQTPCITASPALQNTWRSMKLK